MLGFNSGTGTPSEFARSAARYLDHSNSFVAKLKRMKTLIDSGVFQKLADLESNEVFGLFGGSTKELAHRLAFGGLAELSKNIDELIKEVEADNKEVEAYLKSVKNDNIDNLNAFKTIIQSYNQKQARHWSTINSYVTASNRVRQEIIGIEEVGLQKTAENYTKVYLELEKLVATGSNAAYVFDNFKNVVFFLHRYIGDLERFYREHEEAFTQNLAHARAKAFADNFFAGRGASIASGLTSLLGSKKDEDYLVFSSDGEFKSKVDKFAKEHLGNLFGNLSINKSDYGELEGEVKIADKVGEIFKVPSDIKKLKEDYEILFNKVSSIVRNDVKYVTMTIDPISSIENFLIKIKGVSEVKTFSEFENEFLNDKDKKHIGYIKNVIEQLSDVANDEKKKKAYLKFMKLQVANNVIKEKEKSGGEDDDEKISASAWNNIEANKNVILAFSGGSADDNVKIAVGNLMNDLFGGKIEDKLKKEDGSWKCSQFNKVLNFKNKNTGAFENQIKSFYDFADSKKTDLQNYDLSSWKDLLDRMLSFLFN